MNHVGTALLGRHRAWTVRYLLATILFVCALARAQPCAPTAPITDLPAQAAWATDVLEPGLRDTPALALSDATRTIAAFRREALLTDLPEAAAERALAALERVYGVPLPPRSDGAFDPAELTAWAREAGESISPQGILIMESPAREVVAHAAVYWNSPLTSRVRVVQVPDEVRGDRDAVLALLGTCAVPVDEWLSAPEGVALEFLTEHVSASMLVVAEGAAPGGEWVPPERLIAALRFRDRATEGLDGFSAWFAGERPGIVAATRLLPTLRGSLGPRDLLDLFRTAR